eukprot:scaffold89289_cov63-Phaeocystis_antarctica.AAC.1
MRLCRGCAQGGVWRKRVGGRAGARQGCTAQNSGRMFVFAATLVPRRRDIRHGNVWRTGKLKSTESPWARHPLDPSRARARPAFRARYRH